MGAAVLDQVGDAHEGQAVAIGEATEVVESRHPSVVEDDVAERSRTLLEGAERGGTAR